MPKKENSVQNAAGIGLVLATRPILLDHYNTAYRGENGGFNSAGYHIIFGHTEDVSEGVLMSAVAVSFFSATSKDIS